VNLVSAESLGLAELADLFNEGFSDYLFPMRLDAAALRGHIDENDIDLRDSPVVVVEHHPAAFALLARRGADAWIGGMATTPAHRRRGLGERALATTIQAASDRGCGKVWLEVVDENQSALTLYSKLGFEVVRDLVVWSLPAPGTGPPPGRPVTVESAHPWIAANRSSREPWQRADATLERMRARGSPLGATAVERAGEIAGAIICRDDGGTVTALQAAALDDAAAAEVVLAAAGGDRDVRFTNAPSGESFSLVLAGLGARPLLRQHEMRLRLTTDREDYDELGTPGPAAG
jgi:GNAT superfamily N-acetyltransferase